METAAETVAPIDEAFEWAIVEIMGHRKHAGRMREEERFGAKMCRIDVPTLVADPIEEGTPMSWSVIGWVSHCYGGPAIFSVTLTDVATVMRINRPYASASRYLAPPDDDEQEPF